MANKNRNKQQVVPGGITRPSSDGSVANKKQVMLGPITVRLMRQTPSTAEYEFIKKLIEDGAEEVKQHYKNNPDLAEKAGLSHLLPELEKTSKDKNARLGSK